MPAGKDCAVTPGPAVSSKCADSVGEDVHNIGAKRRLVFPSPAAEKV